MKIMRERRRFLTLFPTILLLFIWAFMQPDSARAQWTTPDANGNINTTGSGNVGIGTTTPAQKLNIYQNDVNGSGLQIDNAAAVGTYKYGVLIQAGSTGYGVTDWPNATVLEGTADGGLVLSGYTGPVKFQTNSRTTRMIIANNGNVGIGTTNPSNLFHVYKASGLSSAAVESGSGSAILSIKPSANTQYSYINLGDGSTYGWQIGKDVTTGGLGGDNGFYIYELTTGQQATRLAIGKGGNVGIGTAPNQNYKMDVAGSVKASGNLDVTGTITGGTINAKYQDVAEWVKSSQKLSPGTVVILDPERTNQVIASRESYDTRVAGVVSDSPGVILGEGGEGKVKVATTGRVRVKVDATRAPIRVGDLLVASDEEGVAMKSEPVSFGGVKMHRPGTIIGKALEPLEKGKGEIMVLLSLQ